MSQVTDGVNSDDCFITVDGGVEVDIVAAGTGQFQCDVTTVDVTIRQHSIIYVAHRFAEGNDDVVTDSTPVAPLAGLNVTVGAVVSGTVVSTVK